MYLMRSLLLLSCRLLGRIYPYSLSQRVRSFHNELYTMWIRNFVGRIGDHSRISCPCKLQGGGEKNISIGNRSTIQAYCVLGCWEKYGNQIFSPSIIIGNHCNIGEYSQITACNKISIGDGLLTGRFVYIGDNNHGGLSDIEGTIPPIERKLRSKGEIVIGNNVWIGDKVTILGGVHIGDNVIIAANAVVTKDILSNTIVAGVPAKVVKSINVCQSQDL